MLPRRYRRSYYSQTTEMRPRPRMFARVIFATLAVLLVWIIGSKVIGLFRDTFKQTTGAVLTVETAAIDSVGVILQGGQEQSAEDKLRVYAGDRIITRPNGTAILSFFDGTRLRLDQGSDVKIVSSEQRNDTSLLSIDLVKGKVWIASPDAMTFSGAITRSITTHNLTAIIPSDTQAQLSSDYQLAVLRAAGIGMSLTIRDEKGREQKAIVGEGQYYNLSKSEDMSALMNGADPYKYRDIIPSNMLRDPFLVKSYSLFRIIITAPQTGSGSSSQANQSPDLTIISPRSGTVFSAPLIRVTGSAGSSIQTVMVNNYAANLQSDGTFSLELNLPASGNQTIHVEAKNAEGVVLAQEDIRVVISQQTGRAGAGSVKPVRITAPGTNDESVTVSTAEVEITGEAPADAAGIMVDDYKLQLFKPGSKTWSYLANANLGNMQVGKNIFTVYALDATGAKSSPSSITIIYEPPNSTVSSSSAQPIRQNAPLLPGSLHVSKPSDGTSATVKEKEIVIEGTTSSDTDSLSINGYKLQLYIAGKTTWNYIASENLNTMKTGKNVYRIVSRNAKGEVLDVLEYTITKE